MSGAESPRGIQTAIAVARANSSKLAPEQIDPRALAADAETHAGKRVVLVGQVVRVTARGGQRLAELVALPAGETTIQAVDLLLDESAELLEPEECYRIVGVVVGRDEIGPEFGRSARDVPLVLVTVTAPAPVGPYGIGCGPPEGAGRGFSGGRAPRRSCPRRVPRWAGGRRRHPVPR